MTLLTDAEIKKHMDWGSIVISPFRAERLNTDSYDLELGPWFWRYTRELNRRPSRMSRGQGFELVDARGDGGLWLAAGERVLGHSVEVAGGRVARVPEYVERRFGMQVVHKEHDVAVTTHLQATSTAARHGISACMCAGWGDVGFVNVWTLEISNHTHDRLWLPVGALIAQIAFTRVAVPDATYTQITGQYQPVGANTVDDIRRAWAPESMLPGPLKVREGWKEFGW